MDIKITESIIEHVKNFINTYLKDYKSNRLEISFSNDSICAVQLKREEILLIAELYYYYENKRWVKMYVTSSFQAAIITDKQCKDDLIWEITECLINTSTLNNDKHKFDCNDIKYEIRQDTYNKNRNFYSNRVSHKLSKNIKSKQIADKMAELIIDNDVVVLSFKTRNEYLNQDMHDSVYLEKRLSISGIEVIHIYVTRNINDKVVIMSDKCTDSIYSISQKESIKDTMDIPENKKILVEILVDMVKEASSFINKVGDKGTKKYSLYSFKEEN